LGSRSSNWCGSAAGSRSFTTWSSTGCWPRSTAGPIPPSPWTGQVTTLAQRLRAVLEDHPGIAGLLRARDPLSPHSLALAEAFLAPLHRAGLPQRETARGFRLIYDYTIGFALSDRTTASEQRVQDAATRRDLHAFVRSLPADRFPVLAALGEHVWGDDRDEQFTASLGILISGLQVASDPLTGR
jgi:hypothetical protein